jgi:hypothetical protein
VLGKSIADSRQLQNFSAEILKICDPAAGGGMTFRLLPDF